MSDREAILRRRALFVTSALASIGCAETGRPATSPGTDPVVVADPAPNARPSDGEASVPERPARPDAPAGVPPLDVPPEIEGEPRRVLEDLAKSAPPVYDRLARMESVLREGCKIEDPECAPRYQRLFEDLFAVEESMRMLRILCPPTSEDGKLAAERVQAHLDHMAEREAAIQRGLEEAAEAGGDSAKEALDRYRTEAMSAHPVVCLSIVCSEW